MNLVKLNVINPERGYARISTKEARLQKDTRGQGAWRGRQLEFTVSSKNRLRFVPRDIFGGRSKGDFLWLEFLADDRFQIHDEIPVQGEPTLSQVKAGCAELGIPVGRVFEAPYDAYFVEWLRVKNRKEELELLLRNVDAGSSAGFKPK